MFEAQNLSQNSRVIIAFQLFIIALRIATGTSLWTFYDEGSVKESIEPNPFESASGIGMNKFFSGIYRLQRWSGPNESGDPYPSRSESRLELLLLFRGSLDDEDSFFNLRIFFSAICFNLFFIESTTFRILDNSS